MKNRSTILLNLVCLGAGAACGGPLGAALGTCACPVLGAGLGEAIARLGETFAGVSVNLFSSRLEKGAPEPYPGFNHDLRRALAVACRETLAAAAVRSAAIGHPVYVDTVLGVRGAAIEAFFAAWDDALAAALSEARAGRFASIDRLFPESADESYLGLTGGAGGEPPAVRAIWEQAYDALLYPVASKVTAPRSLSDLPDQGAALRACVVGGLETEFSGKFNEVIKAPEQRRAWIAFQKLVLGRLDRGIAGVAAEVGAVGQEVAALRGLLGQLVAGDPGTVQAGAQQAFFAEVEQLLVARVAADGRETRTAVAAEGEKTRAVMRQLGAELRAQVAGYQRESATEVFDRRLRQCVELLETAQAREGAGLGSVTALVMARQAEQQRRPVPLPGIAGDDGFVLRGTALALRQCERTAPELGAAFSQFVAAFDGLARAEAEGGSPLRSADWRGKLQAVLGVADRLGAPGTFRSLYLLLLQFTYLCIERADDVVTVEARETLARWKPFAELRYYPPGVNHAFVDFHGRELFGGASFRNVYWHTHVAVEGETLLEVISEHYPNVAVHLDDIVDGLAQANRWAERFPVDEPLPPERRRIVIAPPANQQKHAAAAILDLRRKLGLPEPR